MNPRTVKKYCTIFAWAAAAVTVPTVAVLSHFSSQEKLQKRREMQRDGQEVQELHGLDQQQPKAELKAELQEELPENTPD